MDYKKFWIELGKDNYARVRRYYATHLGCKQGECADALGLNRLVVGRHVKKMRTHWRSKAEDTNGTRSKKKPA